MYTLIKKSSNGKMFQLQETGKADSKPVWYYLANHVLKFAETVKEADSFGIQTEKKHMKDYIIRIEKGTSEAPKNTNGASKEPWKPAPKKEWTPYQKSPEESEKITRLSVLSSAANIVANMEGITPELAYSTVEDLFSRMLTLIRPEPEHKEEGVVL